MFAPNIVHIIASSFYSFEAGQKLVRSLSNYFSSIAIELLLQDGQRQLCGFVWFDRDRTTLLMTDNTPKDCMNERILHIHVYTDQSLQSIMVERFAVVDVAGLGRGHSFGKNLGLLTLRNHETFAKYSPKPCPAWRPPTES